MGQRDCCESPDVKIRLQACLCTAEAPRGFAARWHVSAVIRTRCEEGTRAKPAGRPSTPRPPFPHFFLFYFTRDLGHGRLNQVLCWRSRVLPAYRDCSRIAYPTNIGCILRATIPSPSCVEEDTKKLHSCSRIPRSSTLDDSPLRPPSPSNPSFFLSLTVHALASFGISKSTSSSFRSGVDHSTPG